MTRQLAMAMTMGVVGGPIFGQTATTNAEIIGTISDSTGAPVSGAMVTTANTETGYERSARTSSGGLYRLALLPLGQYSLSVEATGFALYRHSGIVLNAGSSATVNVELVVRSVTTEVVVTAGSPVVDPGRTDHGNTLSSNATRNLPLVSRNPFNFILQQPAVSGRANTEFGVPRKVNANGFNGRINYQLDGSNNVQSDRAGIRLLPISQTWVQEVQAVNNGFAPEFGNSVGTVFNTITRSGTNDFHGEAAYLFRRTPMSARLALLPADQPAPEVNVDTVFGNTGGPVIKDRVFVFGGYERVKRDLPAPVTVPPTVIAQLGLPPSFSKAIPFSQNVTFFIGKVDWQLTPGNRLSMRYSGHRNDSPYNSSSIGGLFLEDRTYQFVDRSHAGTAQMVSVLSENAINELRFQVPVRSQSQNRFHATGSGPAITIPGVANFGNSLDVGFRFEEMTPEVTENFTYNRGSHGVKFGGSVRAVRDTQVQATAALYVFPSAAAYLAARDGINRRTYVTFAQTVGDPAIKYDSVFTGLYAQDTWRPRRNVTVTHGLRYDVYRPPNANKKSPFEYSRRFRTDKNNVVPRLGMALGFGRTVIRASGGMSTDTFQTDLYRRALLNNGTPQLFAATLTPQFPVAPAFPDVLPPGLQEWAPGLQDVTTVSPDFATLYSGNANVSVSRELAPDLALTATYLFTGGNRLPMYRNINLVPSGRRLADGRPIFGSGRGFPGFGSILVAESVGQSIYNALNLTLTSRFSHGVEMFATYTWSHAIDDAPEQNNVDSPSGLLSDPTDRRRDRGNSLTDRRHAFNGHLVLTPPVRRSSRVLRSILNNNHLALIATIQSGDVANMGSNRILNGDPSTASPFQRPLFIGRNTLRTPTTWELNIRYARALPLLDFARLELVAESTNVLNRTNVVGVNTTAEVDPSGNIVRPPPLAWTAAIDQRLVQVGIRLAF